MAGYAVRAQVARAGVRAAPRVRQHAAGPASARPVAPEAVPEVADVDRPGIGGWLDDVRAAWAQTTFYLFDAEGWR